MVGKSPIPSLPHDCIVWDIILLLIKQTYKLIFDSILPHERIRAVAGENGIADEKVVKVYSELEPCSLEVSNCKKELRQYKNAELEYSYDYPGDENAGAGIRRNSIKERKQDLRKLVK